MAKLMLGTVQFGMEYGINNKSGKIQKDEVCDILNFAAENDIWDLDTAVSYGQSEFIIGEFIKSNKTSFNVVSKLPLCDISEVEQNVLNSLNTLGLKKIYGYLFHDFMHFKKNPKILDELLLLKHKGYISKIGFSLYFAQDLKWLLDNGIEFDIVQIPYSVFDQRFISFFPFLKKLGIEICVRSVFLQGLVFKDVSDLDNRFLKLKSKLNKLRDLAADNKISIADICLNFASQNEYIDKVIIGVDSKNHLKKNLKNLDNFSVVKDIQCDLVNLQETDEKVILPINW